LSIPDDNHVMRHIPQKKLLRDGDGNILGISPYAFEVREVDQNRLSTNWLEYFEGSDHAENVESTVQSMRDNPLRPIKKTANCGFGVGNVLKIKDICSAHGIKNPDVVHNPTRDNKSHSRILRIPQDHMDLYNALADEAFLELHMNGDIP